MKIRQYFLELQLKISGMFLRHSVVCPLPYGVMFYTNFPCMGNGETWKLATLTAINFSHFITHLFIAIKTKKHVKQTEITDKQSELNKITQYTSNERISVSVCRLNTPYQLEQNHIKREKRARVAYGQQRTRFLVASESMEAVSAECLKRRSILAILVRLQLFFTRMLYKTIISYLNNWLIIP